MIRGSENEGLLSHSSHNILSQPASLKHSNSIWAFIQRIFSCGPESGHSPLSRTSLESFYQLSAFAAEDFDANDSAHVRRFDLLLRLVFPEDAEKCPSVLENALWPTLGFQTEKAYTDLRSGGILALDVLIKLAYSRPRIVQDALDFSRRRGNFLFACSVISATLFLKQFFHFGLLKSKVTMITTKKVASKRCLVYFLALMDPSSSSEEKRESFLELIEVYSVKIFEYWKQEDSKKQLNIAQYNQLEKTFELKFSKEIESLARKSIRPKNFEDFIAAIEGIQFK